MINVKLDKKAKATVSRTLDLGGGQSIDDRFVKLKDSENIYYGESVDGCKVVINLKAYYENSSSEAKKYIPTAYNKEYPDSYYPEAIVFGYSNVQEDGSISGGNCFAIWLKYDESGNVYCHFSYDDNNGNPYVEVNEAIKVLNAGQSLSELPERVLFEVPEGFSMKVLGCKTVVTEIVFGGTSYIVTAYK